jgi:hypothetical protein
MPRGTPSAVRDTAFLYSELINRRVSIRYPAGPATRTTLGRQPGEYLRRVRVHDISRGGIALVLRRPLKSGATVYVQVKNRILDFSFDLAAEVRHASRHTRGRWIVGFAFVRELSLAELATLL